MLDDLIEALLIFQQSVGKGTAYKVVHDDFLLQIAVPHGMVSDGHRLRLKELGFYPEHAPNGLEYWESADFAGECIV